MDSPSSVLSSPSKALNPLSPERINQQAVPTSPSAAADFLRLQRKGNRGLSDVQAKVAYLNHLSRGNSPAAASAQAAASAGGAAALQRAILGREEAESALVRVSGQLSESQSREHRISERLESLLEELRSAKERQAHERLVFEKEIRKSRKEAFRAGSALVKTQEDLKHARIEAKILKEEVQLERGAKEQAKQEAFERAYALAGLTEELEVLKGQLRSAEANTHADTLEAQAQQINKQDIGRMSLAEGDLALLLTPTPRRPKRSAEDPNITPVAESTDPTCVQDTTPKRQRLSDITPQQGPREFVVPYQVHDLIEDLRYDLDLERRLRLRAEDMVEYMKVECMFNRCTCRIREEIENAALAKQQIHTIDHHECQDEMEGHEDESHNIASAETVTSVDDEAKVIETKQEEEGDGAEEKREGEGEPLITFSPVTGTFRTIPSPVRGSPKKQIEDSTSEEPEPLAAHRESELEAQPVFASPIAKYESHAHESQSESIMQSEAYSRDLTPGSHNSPMIAEAQWQARFSTGEHAENEIVSLKRIPLRTDDEQSNRFATVPGTPVSREQALAQIRARRGRTSTMKRSVSANDAALRASAISTTPVRAARRIPGLQHTDPRGEGAPRSRRDLSAPMRMLHH
ncbi:hypothetical protein P175DRAFT_0491362 [Aspergillus ochraceoroseus IBT 24754]|uniref:Uncharacterized protein n=2 Tax=Aspergillus ochraceoroseus TaxID=138278 RepID=A0A2T5M343_9EURO|nr:uncharacterized protein P175DRAFT_0491362 [Aspergillus ochraceoroseus IBT 24754]KKK14863.1 hypothetical protein AOCH_001762 [Aspergillus ochraceoroseus]PTU22954.1 hypothetical protein P175DRAFT_0491362 [Aspergillus ochraceoroseus IBT 24754]